MATRALTCYIAVCDLCGSTSDDAEYGIHATTPEEAIEHATDNHYDERRGWTFTSEGVLVCDMKTDSAHEDAHAEAGKRMGRDAMTVTFSSH